MKIFKNKVTIFTFSESHWTID